MAKIEELEHELKQLLENRQKLSEKVTALEKICKTEFETVLPPVQTCINDLTNMLNEAEAKLNKNIKEYYFLNARIAHIKNLIQACKNGTSDFWGVDEPSFVYEAHGHLFDLDTKIERITKQIEKLKNKKEPS